MERSIMINEYFDIYQEKIKEYGEKTCVLFECGAFYEIYQINNEKDKIGNAKELSNILNMVYTCKIIGKINVHFIGFNTSYLDKYLPILLNANYTVVLVNQLESSEEKSTKGNLKRGVTKIYSPSLQPLDYNSGNLLCVLFDIKSIKSSSKKNASIVYSINTSICSVNNEHNNIELIENLFTCIDSNSLNQCLDELDRVLYRYFAKEMHVKIKGKIDETFWGIKNIRDFFNNNYENTIIKVLPDIKDYNDIDIQNAFLKDIFTHINFGLISPIEYMNLSNNNLSIINLIMTLEFISRHDFSYVSNLNLPKIIDEKQNLILELNTVSQLNIVSNTELVNFKKFASVFDVINYTKTSIGKRHLKNILCKPFKNINDINIRYNITEELRLISKNETIDELLCNMYDFEKLHRKMCLLQLHQCEFNKLNDTYILVIKLFDVISKYNIPLPKDDIIKRFKEYIEDYRTKFDFEKMKNIDLNTSKDNMSNYFLKNIIPELDSIQISIDTLEFERENLRLVYDSCINKNNNIQMIKLLYTENDGYAFTCTKIRYELLIKKQVSLKNCKMKQTNNAVKFYPEKLEELSNKLLNFKELLYKKIKIHYFNILKEYSYTYNDVFIELKKFIEIIDVCNSNLKCSLKYNYVKPIIDNTSNSSFFEAIQIRHPIIERLGTNYIPNDISLNDKNGILLYGVNSGGKSSLLRAIGINIILAQCGLYVPCKKFTFNPFNTIISQVDLTDNLFSGKSSYVNEMMGLKKILNCSGPNTLVLSDETCKGTENYSSISLVVSIIKFLLDNNTKFFFTTHLHEISKIDDIKLNKKVQVCHLDILIQYDEIIFNRIIKNGSGSDLYGLEIAKNILQNNELIDYAFLIRNKLVNNISTSICNKKSVYNNKKIIKYCEICKSTKNLETHHILFQSTANENGFLESGIHKNHLSNLSILCKKCHDNVTYNRIIVHGYKQSTNGVFLDWTNNTS